MKQKSKICINCKYLTINTASAFCHYIKAFLAAPQDEETFNTIISGKTHEMSCYKEAKK